MTKEVEVLEVAGIVAAAAADDDVLLLLAVPVIVVILAANVRVSIVYFDVVVAQ